MNCSKLGVSFWNYQGVGKARKKDQPSSFPPFFFLPSSFPSSLSLLGDGFSVLFSLQSDVAVSILEREI